MFRFIVLDNVSIVYKCLELKKEQINRVRYDYDYNYC